MADTYEGALVRAKRDGASHCDDAALMAGFLQANAQILLGAVSPKMIWGGAQARDMTTAELAKMIHDHPGQAADLMWEAP